MKWELEPYTLAQHNLSNNNVMHLKQRSWQAINILQPAHKNLMYQSSFLQKGEEFDSLPHFFKA